ncbi:MAG TPA: ANTAR domain-containing protein [Acidimicrobiales bacterium]|nr:ANTAR domain-containing protein [Acidimicrobiales bacterium]
MSDNEAQISKLEADAQQANAHIRRLDAEAVAREQHIGELDARALARDQRIIELVKEVEGLHTATESRSVIERAKGVIMSTMHCGPDAAFAVLVAQSQAENRKLRDIAADLAGQQDRS